MDVETKYALLKENIKNYGKIAVAYSGGLDSTFLLKVCHDVLGDNVIAVSIRTDLQPVREYLGSEEFVKKKGLSILFSNLMITLYHVLKIIRRIVVIIAKKRYC